MGFVKPGFPEPIPGSMYGNLAASKLPQETGFASLRFFQIVFCKFIVITPQMDFSNLFLVLCPLLCKMGAVDGTEGDPDMKTKIYRTAQPVPFHIFLLLLAGLAVTVFGQESGGTPLDAELPAGMVQIPAGSFTMGSPVGEPNRYYDEVQHQVSLSAFKMGRYEVTQREYRRTMGTNPSVFRGDDLPVENVSWLDAVEYCNRRSQKEGLTPAYTITGRRDSRKVEWNRSANGYRLPTEAEWEYACRAGTVTAWSFGSDGSDMASYGWTYGNSGEMTHPVGQKKANGWGLYDMHGNVWEWCWDWFGAYPGVAQTDPTGATSGSARVLRGGCWNSSSASVRSASRYYYVGPRISLLGFRVVRP